MQITARQIEKVAEYSRRKIDALKLFRPYANQDPIFVDSAIESAIVGGNRSGKTLSAAVRFAAIARDEKIFLSDGTEVFARREHQRGEFLTMWVFGVDMNHIGKTIHRVLFRSEPALFHIIRDEETYEWRAYQQWRDSDRKSERKTSPPLIPPSCVVPRSWVWENKAARNFEKVVIRNPSTGKKTAEIRAWSSQSDEPPAGDPVDVIWIDEVIRKPEFYAEYYARLLDKQGFMYWSSFPGNSGAACAEKLEDIRLRAASCKDEGSGRVSYHELPTDENPHIPKDQIEEWAKGFSEEEYKIRVKGKPQSSSLLMYPKFDERIHSAIIDDASEEDAVSRTLRLRNGEPPEDWMRELILDPGTSHPAVLLCAVPPPNLGAYYIPYREVYTPYLDAGMLAGEAEEAINGYEVERFIIDNQAGKQRPMGFGVNIRNNYEKAFKRRGLTSRAFGCRFIPGSSDVAGRIAELIGAMSPAPGSKFPFLRIYRDGCPNLVKQLKRYKKELRSGEIGDWKPAARQQIDLAQCLEYGISRKPEYTKPSGSVRLGKADRMFNAFRRQFAQKPMAPRNTYSLGPHED